METKKKHPTQRQTSGWYPVKTTKLITHLLEIKVINLKKTEGKGNNNFFESTINRF